MIKNALPTLSVSTAGWMSTPTNQASFVWSHSNEEPADLGVIIVGPIGPESLHCHRSIKCLAETLQSNGITTLRYDHIGMGNSSNDLFIPRLMDDWIANIGTLHQYLTNGIGAKSVAIVALRSGSLLAAKYLETHSVDHLILWYPYIQGPAFYRDITMIDGMLEICNDGLEPYVNAGGYPITKAIAEDLKSIDLVKMESRVRSSVFTIQSKESKALSRLEQKYVNNGNPYQHRVSPSLPRMARMAQFSEVPVDDIDIISLHISKQVQEHKTKGPYKSPTQIFACQQFGGFSESTLISFESSKIFGITCEPDNNLTGLKEKPVILITNGGAAHHIGPNRLHTDLARELVQHQFTSVRFDLSTLGDSPAEHTDSNPNPYPSHAVNDIDQMIGAVNLKLNPERIIIIGLCSGAHNAFHAQLQLEHHNIVETVLINPLTFYMREGDSTLAPESVNMEMNKNYYQGQARSLKVWLNLLKDPAKVIKLSGFVLKLVASKCTQLIKPVARMLNLIPPEDLQEDIEKLLEAKQHLSFFISNNDPGHRMILQQAGSALKKGIKSKNIKVTITSSVDHTFTTLESRRELIKSISEHLREKYI